MVIMIFYFIEDLAAEITYLTCTVYASNETFLSAFSRETFIVSIL